MKLSYLQRFAVHMLLDAPADDARALVQLGASRNRTLRALERRGLVHRRGGLWRLTPAAHRWIDHGENP